MKELLERLGKIAGYVVVTTALIMLSQVALAQAKPALVRDTDNAARQAFQILMGSDVGNPRVNDFTVPANKRLVIEYVSTVSTFDFTGPLPIGAVILRTRVNGVDVDHVFPQRLTECDSLTGATSHSCATAQQTRIYADPSTKVELGTRGSIGISNTLLVNISGHLIDFP